APHDIAPLPRAPPSSTLLPYTPLFRSLSRWLPAAAAVPDSPLDAPTMTTTDDDFDPSVLSRLASELGADAKSVLCDIIDQFLGRSEEHTSELQHVKISYAVLCWKQKTP